ncbi:hypothetical protein TWF506_005879 [Arthrobotrys conoides]|uniref:Uncharacterized protein n=1 Tax=Arthrobotrys conoides TaxID=74498 RepID=A0AAN8RW97_9PEZI
MVARSPYYRDRPLRTFYTPPFQPSIYALPPNNFLSESIKPIIESLVRRIPKQTLRLVIAVDPVIMDGQPTFQVTFKQPKHDGFETKVSLAIRLALPEKPAYQIVFTEAKRRIFKEPVLSTRNYSAFRFPGQSIGVDGLHWGMGTVGGYIRFTDPDLEDSIFGMTCHHVLQPTRHMDIIDSGCQGIWSQHLNKIGILHEEVKWNMKGTDKIVTPAALDHSNSIQEARKRAAKLYVEASSITKKPLEKSNQAAGEATIEKRIQAAEERLKFFQLYDCEFGKISITSGYQVDPRAGNSIDWGLVKLSETSEAANICIYPDSGWGGRTERAILTVGDPVPGEEVCKIGRSTNFTSGIVSSALHAIDLERNGIITTEWAIVGDKNLPFSTNGDSGSWVINIRHEVVGMIIGYNGLVSYMTPIKRVIEDIETTTGKKVVLHGNKGQTWPWAALKNQKSKNLSGSTGCYKL